MAPRTRIPDHGSGIGLLDGVDDVLTVGRSGVSGGPEHADAGAGGFGLAVEEGEAGSDSGSGGDEDDGLEEPRGVEEPV